MKPTVMIELSHIAIRSSRLARIASHAVSSIPDATAWYDTSTSHPPAIATQQKQIRREHRRTHAVLAARLELHLALTQLRPLVEIHALAAHIEMAVVLIGD